MVSKAADAVTVKVDGTAHTLTWRAEPDGTRSVVLDGEPAAWKPQRLGPGRWLFRQGMRQVLVDVDGAFPKATVSVASPDGEPRTVAIEVVPSAPEGSVRARAADERASQPSIVRAMMPGRVVKVLVRVGEAVRAGQAMLVVEAMKMQNDVVAPRDAHVLAVHCAEGAAVESHQDLVSLG